MPDTPLVPPSLIGDKSYLRPATAADVPGTYHWYLLSDPQSMSPHALPFLTPGEAAEAFRERKRSTEYERFMVVPRKADTPVGWIEFQNLNPHNRSAELQIIIDPDERRKGYGLQAMELLCRYLFEDRGLNKVLMHTAEYNKALVALLEKAGFRRDGILRRHYLYRGEFRDGALYSLLHADL